MGKSKSMIKSKSICRTIDGRVGSTPVTRYALVPTLDPAYLGRKGLGVKI